MTKSPTTGPAPARHVDGAPAFAGRLFVLERLGLDTYDLGRKHPDPGELQTLAKLVSRHADRLDGLDHELRRTAAGAIERLTRIRAGNHRDVQSHGTLRLLGSDLETLGARFDLASEQLGQAVLLYRRAAESAAEVPSARTEAARARTSTAAAVPVSAQPAPLDHHPTPARSR